MRRARYTGRRSMVRDRLAPVGGQPNLVSRPHLLTWIWPGMEAGMEATIGAIRADIASLRAHVAKFRTLAEQHRTADQIQIADKLMEVAAELEAKANQLEASAPG